MKNQSEINARIIDIKIAIKHCKETIDSERIMDYPDEDLIRANRILRSMHTTELRILRWILSDGE